MRTDVAVIGSGPAGSAVALELARAGVSVVVVDAGDRHGDKMGESLAPSVRPLLQRLGLWDAFLSDGHLASHSNRSAWGSDRIEENHFITSPYGAGWHLDRRRFDDRLRQAAVKAGAACRMQTKVVAGQHDPDGWTLELLPEGDAPALLHAAYLVDATGRAGWVARRLNIARRNFDNLVGFGQFLSPTTSGFEDSATLIEAMPGGWWYSALLPDGRLVVVYFTDADLPATCAVRERDGWEAALAATRYTSDRVTQHGGVSESEPIVASAGAAVAAAVTGDAWLAVGDAAASYDPLSSCGIATALASGIRGAAAVQRALDGDPDALESYSASIYKGFGIYLDLHAAYYAAETRWPSSPFWNRRARQADNRVPNADEGSIGTAIARAFDPVTTPHLERPVNEGVTLRYFTQITPK